MTNEDNRVDVVVAGSEQSVSIDIDEGKRADEQPRFSAQLRATLM